MVEARNPVAEAVSDCKKIPASGQEIGRLGKLSTRLACSNSEIRKAQKVRYRVFCKEFEARKRLTGRVLRIDRDKHDQVCDHLLVLDEAATGKPIVVGTQRFLVRAASEDHPAFYSQMEFDLEMLCKKHGDKRFMELGRSCILPEYRSKRTMELMWHGTWAYALNEKVDVMTGCASFSTLEVQDIDQQLAFLMQHARADDEWDVTSQAEHAIDLKPFQKLEIDPKKALRGLPPLIKGYLRLGAMFSSVAVRDPDFGTIDILVLMPVDKLNQRYVNYYGADAGKHRS